MLVEACGERFGRRLWMQENVSMIFKPTGNETSLGKAKVKMFFGFFIAYDSERNIDSLRVQKIATVSNARLLQKL